MGGAGPVRAVLFDIGGILELTPDTGWRARWEARLGVEPGGIDRRLFDVWRDGAVGRITEQQAEERTGAALGLAGDELRRLLDDLWAEYLGTPNTDLIAYFGALRPRVRTGIVSNSFVGAREREQARYGFAALCDDVVYSHEVGLWKPDARIYALACERLGVRPQEAAFLDDVEENVRGARAVGLHAVLYRDNAQAVAALDALLPP